MLWIFKSAHFLGRKSYICNHKNQISVSKRVLIAQFLQKRCIQETFCCDVLWLFCFFVSSKKNRQYLVNPTLSVHNVTCFNTQIKLQIISKIHWYNKAFIKKHTQKTTVLWHIMGFLMSLFLQILGSQKPCPYLDRL